MVILLLCITEVTDRAQSSKKSYPQTSSSSLVRLTKMAKKKKGGDTRGYATSNAASSKQTHSKAVSKPAGGKARKQIQVSQSAQDEMESLLDELKQILKQRGDISDKGQIQPLAFSVEDKKMIKKIANLVRLVNLKLCSTSKRLLMLNNIDMVSFSLSCFLLERSTP